MGKGLFQSKTFYVNLLTALVSIGASLAGNEFISAHPQAVAVLAAVVAFANIALRVISDKPITSL